MSLFDLEMREVGSLGTLEVSMISSTVFSSSIFWGHSVCVVFLLSYKLCWAQADLPWLRATAISNQR